jgi:DNA invertase Pin-like site-specific DNA recombinase
MVENVSEKVVNMLRSGWYSLDEIAKETKLSYEEVYRILSDLKGDSKMLRKSDKSDKKKFYYRIAN